MFCVPKILHIFINMVAVLIKDTDFIHKLFFVYYKQTHAYTADVNKPLRKEEKGN